MTRLHKAEKILLASSTVPLFVPDQQHHIDKQRANMVRYIITPWRSHSELLSVRTAFYPSRNPSSDELDDQPSRGSNTDHERRTAVARVSVWVQRGNCPHSVESTALLVSAMLNDSRDNSAYAVRAAYSAAFSRYGL